MDINLYSKWGELPLSDNYPDPLPGLQFPGAEIRLAQDERKDYVYFIQQLKTLYFTIRYCCFYTFHEDVLTVINAPGVTYRLGISHSHQVMTKSLGKQVYHERSFNIFSDPGPSAEYPLKPDSTFIFLDLVLARDYLLYLQHYYPVTQEFIRKALKGIAGKLTQNNQVAVTETWRWKEELTDWCFDANRKSANGDIIANRLIVKGLELAQPEPPKKGIKFSMEEINRICDVAEIIRNSDEPPPLDILTASTGLSSYKFNAGFNKVFGHPASKHKFEDMMMYALRLIDCKGASLEQVAILLGYEQPELFADDFSKRFGYAPFDKDKPA